MDVIAEIKARLANCPETRLVETPTSMEVLPQDDAGFPVTLHVTDAGFTVHFAGWHEDFASPEEAVNCFGFGLSDACRLCVVYRGAMPTKWSFPVASSICRTGCCPPFDPKVQTADGLRGND
jgi:hypothetical protein